ncbi:MAG: NAD-dependent epimerase/dehydratase family protein [Candidatus Marinarcus sp.]|uniref:NAD-dependent epimerase/dehydratase family protein n=1 Tax=Candidatus Marinarcus sp. TaxID=3100987 RepID=UPI003B00C8CF
MKKILVTGANGFIGGYFIDKYKSKYNIQKFSFLNDDVENLHIEDVDIIIHLSALVHQINEVSVQEYDRVNVVQTLYLAKRAKENGVKQFVFISTIAVYSGELEKLDENSYCDPITYYGKSKLKAEQELLKLNDETFIVSIIRPPMVYGNNAPGNIDLLVKLVKKALIIPLGRITNKRSFVYVGNLSYLINEVIEQQHNGIFLASDDKPLSTTMLIELIAKNLDKKIYLTKIPFFEILLKMAKPSFHKRLYGSLVVDDSATRECLDLTYPYTIEDGIKLMIGGENI